MFKHTKKRLALRIFLILACITLILGGGTVLMLRKWYKDALLPVSSSQEVRRVTINSGASVSDIAKQLEGEGIIRDARAFETYVRGRGEQVLLKAGVFELSAGWSVQEIVSVLVEGEEASDLFTIGPGLRVDEIKKRLIESGFSEVEVIKALDPATYRSHPILASLPVGASLEGYIYPESFRITASSSAQDIIKASLDELDRVITDELEAGFKAQGLTTYQAIVLASIVEKEVPGPTDRKTVAQIFLKRLKEGINLGSDATYYYASAVFGGEPFPDLDSPYNTRIYPGLPPGPINNVSRTALEAVAYPSDTDYLFFVTGDDGVNHFTNTEAEHNQAVNDYCKISCAPGYVPEGR